jgi:hypothetical protein
MGGTNGLGAYVSVSYNSATGTYDISTSASNISQYIPSGEAILIQSENGSSAGSIVVNESDKTTEGSDALFGRASKKSSAIRVNLMQINNDATLSLIDGAMTTFHVNHSNELDGDDVQKMNGSAENLSFNRSNKSLAIERRAELRAGDTSYISLSQLKKQTYVLQIIGEEISSNGVQAILIDRYNNQTSVLDLTAGKTEFTFTVTNDPASMAANRFLIVYAVKNKSAATEGVKTNIEAVEVMDDKQVTNTAKIRVYPNPVPANTIHLNMNNMKAGRYELSLYNTNGQQIAHQVLEYAGQNSPVQMTVKGNFTPGRYELKCEGRGASLNCPVIKA